MMVHLLSGDRLKKVKQIEAVSRDVSCFYLKLAMQHLGHAKEASILKDER